MEKQPLKASVMTNNRLNEKKDLGIAISRFNVDY
jgi:hypothetical protein